MAGFTCLKRLDAETIHLQGMLASLLRGGANARAADVSPAPCLRFELLQQGCSLICRVEASDWASTHLPTLAGLDWSSLPATLLDGLVGIDNPLDLRQSGLEYVHARVLPPSVKPAPRLLPALEAAEGRVWIERIKGSLHAQEEEPLADALRIPLVLIVASTTLACNRLLRLVAGDILLLPIARPWLASGRHRLSACEIDFDNETFTMTHTPPLPASSKEDLPLLDVASMPLRLEVAFSGIELSVAELSRLRSGSVLQLPPHATTQMQLTHNGHCIATGELVQVGDVLGLQLVQAPRLA